MRLRNGPIAISAQNATWGAKRLARRPTASRRSLPDFLIVGAQKAGTTSLYHYLQQSQHIRSSSQKEVHYFDHHYGRGPMWYRSHFPIAGDGRVWQTGEASPFYLLHPHVPQRVANLVPDVRVFILLRDPVQRAYSHFQHSRAHLMEPETDFLRAVDLESERTDTEWQELLAGSARAKSVEKFSYVRRGLYAPQVLRWRAAFGADQIFVETAERLAAEPAAVMELGLRHLGLPALKADLAHETRNRRRYPKLSAAQRSALAPAFTDDVAETEDLLGRPLHWQIS